MNIYVGADHNGYDFKQSIIALLQRMNHTVIDEGDLARDPEDDFPQFASRVVQALLADPDQENSRGILVCGSGQGMCMAANRFRGIRASLCWNVAESRSARNDDNSNILCLSAKYTALTDAEAIVTSFLATPFAAAPRFKRRLEALDSLG